MPPYHPHTRAVFFWWGGVRALLPISAKFALIVCAVFRALVSEWGTVISGGGGRLPPQKGQLFERKFDPQGMARIRHSGRLVSR